MGVTVPGNREYNNGWHTALDLKPLLTVAEAIAISAVERRESRGAQFREDYPEKNPDLGQVNMVVRKNERGEMEIRRESVPRLPEHLQQIVEEMQ